MKLHTVAYQYTLKRIRKKCTCCLERLLDFFHFYLEFELISLEMRKILIYVLIIFSFFATYISTLYYLRWSRGIRTSLISKIWTNNFILFGSVTYGTLLLPNSLRHTILTVDTCMFRYHRYLTLKQYNFYLFSFQKCLCVLFFAPVSVRARAQ